MESIRAFRVHTVNGKPECRFERLTIDDLDQGDVLIRTAYSAITYKDAMAARGVGKNVRTDRPCVTGVDLSGVVVSSADDRFHQGDEVIVTNYKLGANHDGGYADYARVPGDWIVPLPKGLTLYEAMCLGTSGLTAALAVQRLEEAGLRPTDGAMAVTGATGGVGSLAIDLFAKRGFRVVAISGKRDQETFLRTLGAEQIMSREELLGNRAPLAPPLFAGALDNVGGDLFRSPRRPSRALWKDGCRGHGGRGGAEDNRTAVGAAFDRCAWNQRFQAVEHARARQAMAAPRQ